MTRDSATVFVVDDDASLCKALERLIRSIGINVQTFDTAQAFLAHGLPHQQPACLVLDVRMPGTSGIELQEQLNGSDFQIPIIFITGHGSIPMSVKAMKAGAADFLEKPFEDQQLIDAIHAAIARSEAFQNEHSEIVELQRRIGSLTLREHDVFLLVVSGLLNKQIAFDLEMSEKTVKIHRGRVMRKMKAESLAGLVRMAERISRATSK